MSIAALLAALVPPQPLDVLHEWDGRREAAWAAGSPAAVRELYVPGSSAGEYDAALVRRYRDRGLRVQRLRTQVLRAAVLEQRPGRLVLRVTDRVAVLEVTRAGEPVRLPRDGARTRTVELRLVEDRWLVAGVSGS